MLVRFLRHAGISARGSMSLASRSRTGSCHAKKEGECSTVDGLAEWSSTRIDQDTGGRGVAGLGTRAGSQTGRMPNTRRSRARLRTGRRRDRIRGPAACDHGPCDRTGSVLLLVVRDPRPLAAVHCQGHGLVRQEGAASTPWTARDASHMNPAAGWAGNRPGGEA